MLSVDITFSHSSFPLNLQNKNRAMVVEEQLK